MTPLDSPPRTAVTQARDVDSGTKHAVVTMRGGSNVAWKDSWQRFVSFWEGAAAGAGPPGSAVDNGGKAGDPGRVDGDVAANTPVLHTYTF